MYSSGGPLISLWCSLCVGVRTYVQVWAKLHMYVCMYYSLIHSIRYLPAEKRLHCSQQAHTAAWVGSLLVLCLSTNGVLQQSRIHRCWSPRYSVSSICSQCGLEERTVYEEDHRSDIFPYLAVHRAAVVWSDRSRNRLLGHQCVPYWYVGRHFCVCVCVCPQHTKKLKLMQ